MRNAHPTHANDLAQMCPRQLTRRFRVPGVPLTAAAALLALGTLSACGASSPDYYSYDDARSTAMIAAESTSSRSPRRAAEPPSPPPADYQSGETYAQLEENQFVPIEQDQMATFSLDVDTGSYTIMRRDINSQRLPSPDGVRVEEFVNYFDYGDRPPAPDSGAPFAVHLEGAPSYFGEGLTLLRVGVQGVEIPTEQRPAANLVFLVDVSGSMNSPEKLGLVQYALTALVNSLRPDDTIGIVVYASSQGVLLQSTPVANRGVLLEAIESLRAGGSTNGEAGIRAAYALAEDHFRPGGINRVILCTDGDFNVGLTGDELIDLIERYRDRDITLTTLGFGRGNYNDRDMERLADHGNGNYAFIDGRNEALRVLHEDLQGTLQVIAKDVKVQVVFNSEVVERFRLIGYENRVLAHEDFDDDEIDAAEIGSGQFTTAYLEVALRDNAQAGLDPRQLAEVRLRYKEPDGDESRLLRYPFSVGQLHRSFQEASPVFRFGAAVAEYAEILRRSDHSQGARFDEVIQIADTARWSRQPATEEFVQLVASARDLWARQAANR
jgi:Ca-activated chloride channel family protein